VSNFGRREAEIHKKSVPSTQIRWQNCVRDATFRIFKEYFRQFSSGKPRCGAFWQIIFLTARRGVGLVIKGRSPDARFESLSIFNINFQSFSDPAISSDSDSDLYLRNRDFPTPWPKIISQWIVYFRRKHCHSFCTILDHESDALPVTPLILLVKCWLLYSINAVFLKSDAAGNKQTNKQTNTLSPKSPKFLDSDFREVRGLGLRRPKSSVNFVSKFTS
jgi:hypothetical protein